MDIQWIAALSCVALASCYLAFSGFRAWKGRKSGCGGGCGCSSAAKPEAEILLIPSDQLMLRRRTGPKT